MDEPTAALTAAEVDKLYEIIRTLKAGGKTILYISHRLKEIFDIADRVTVLRDGRWIGTEEVASLSQDDVVRMMVGRDVQHFYQRADAAAGEVAIEVRGLTRRGAFSNVSFTARRGEILGIAGLMGSGREELVKALYGLVACDAGEVRVGGRPARIANPRDAIRLGIAFVTEDRKDAGIFPLMSVKENVSLTVIGKLTRLAGTYLDIRRGAGPARRIHGFPAPPLRLRGPGGHVPERRQPAEGRALARPRGRVPHPARPRADARGGRGRQGRDLPAPGRAFPQGHRADPGVVRPARAHRRVQPRARRLAGRGHGGAHGRGHQREHDHAVRDGKPALAGRGAVISMWGRIWERYFIYAVAAVTLGVFAILTPNILSGANIINVLTNAAMVAIAAAGMTFAITGGGFDRSPGARPGGGRSWREPPGPRGRGRGA